MEELIEYDDVFYLNKRVKQIRKSYKLFFNRRTKKVELHDGNFYGKCMEFNLPLYPDVLDKIDSTRIENSSRLFANIDSENRKIQSDLVKTYIQNCKNNIKV